MPRDSAVNRRSFLKAAGGAAAAATLAGCAADPDETSPSDGGDGGSGGGNASDGGDGGSGGGNVLTYARGNDSGTLDPQNTTSGEDVKVTNQVYDQLIMFKPGETSLREGLATDWSLEGTTASLTLREGVKFHNDEEFTAEDVVATYNRFVNPDYEHYPGDDYISAYGPFTLGNWVDEVTTDGDYTVTMQLSQQYAPFLRNLAMFAASILSKKAIEEMGTDLKSNPIGTGPFQFENWDNSNQRIRLSANGDYWGDAPKVDEVVFTAVGSNTSRAQTLDSGGANIIDGIGAQASKIVDNSSNAELVEKAGINIGYMAFNMAKVEAFREKKVRQAISYAVNTKAIVDTIYKGIAEQASQPIPSNVMGYNESLDPYPQDLDQAQSLLEEAGYGDGFSFELATFKNPRTYNPSPIQAAQTVKSNLAEVGIEVSINQQSFNPFLDYTSAGNHDACFLGWMTDNADPDNFYYSLLHPGVSTDDVPDGQDWVSFDAEGYNTLNSAGWANTDFMSLVEEAQKTYDESARTSNYKEAAQIAHDEAPWVFIDHAKELRGVGNRVEGFTLAPIGGPFLNLVSLK
ncbi:peptide/nickel transport system substrate-binding protein [Halogranum amylolyticum]|uniref:Peptide/nickel transport system substrate-binding protein n=1 Tax=Halogranum amylolyticum TaxID=660520 RepID=A0A1H8TV61_9EURY|nr:ABC transporter substrate-binding protein [Halogranum amylolyticum]SEO94514.1 peptide/nickel transport system substrate-binding protein [Halogranum amylolyticum]